MIHNNTLIALGSALLACLIWSGNFVIARSVHEWIPPFTLATTIAINGQFPSNCTISELRKSKKSFDQTTDYSTVEDKLLSWVFSCLKSQSQRKPV